MDTLYICQDKACTNRRIHRQGTFHTADLPMCHDRLMISHERMSAQEIMDAVRQHWIDAPSQSSLRSYWYTILAHRLNTLTDRNIESHCEVIGRMLPVAASSDAILALITEQTLRLLDPTGCRCGFCNTWVPFKSMTPVTAEVDPVSGMASEYLFLCASCIGKAQQQQEETNASSEGLAERDTE